MRHVQNDDGSMRYPSMSELRRMRGAEIPPEIPGPDGDLIPSELASPEWIAAALEWRPVDHVTEQSRLLDQHDGDARSTRERERREQRARMGLPEPEPRPPRRSPYYIDNKELTG
jgi:hypothetical protein